jgi:hypothetical protein
MGDRGLGTGSETASKGTPYNTRATEKPVTLLNEIREPPNPTTALITHSANTALKTLKNMSHADTLAGGTRQCSEKMNDREPSRKKNEMMESGKTVNNPLKKLRFTVFIP